MIAKDAETIDGRGVCVCCRNCFDSDARTISVIGNKHMQTN